MTTKPDMESFCADRLKLLADETRLKVLLEIYDQAKTVAQINEVVGVEQSLLSHHLKLLREAGFVTSQRLGKGRIYSLSPEVRCGLKHQYLNLGCCKLEFPKEP